MGEMAGADSVGTVGNADCGEMLRLWVKFKEQNGKKVIDVREPFEYEIAKVDGVPLLPLSQLQQRFTELDPNQQYYLLCKVGARSHSAVEFLRQQGFKYVKNVKDGIIAWSVEIDRNVPRY